MISENACKRIHVRLPVRVNIGDFPPLVLCSSRVPSANGLIIRPEIDNFIFVFNIANRVEIWETPCFLQVPQLVFPCDLRSLTQVYIVADARAPLKDEFVAAVHDPIHGWEVGTLK